MNEQINGGEVELPREENRGRLQNLVGLLEISVLALELFDPLLLGRGDTRAVLGVDLRLQHPLAQSLRADPTFGPIA
jgi:hypothetical protein